MIHRSLTMALSYRQELFQQLLTFPEATFRNKYSSHRLLALITTKASHACLLRELLFILHDVFYSKDCMCLVISDHLST